LNLKEQKKQIIKGRKHNSWIFVTQTTTATTQERDLRKKLTLFHMMPVGVGKLFPI
jgi:hypothetical protein